MKTQARNIVGTLALGISLLVSVPARSATWPNTFTTNSQAVMNGYVTPQMFGAAGDGVTGDTASMQATLNHAGEIFIPSGNYVVTNLYVTNNTHIRGSYASRLIYGASATNFFLNTSANTNIQIEGVIFDGGLRTNPVTLGTRHGINMNLGTNGNSWVRYNEFIGFSGYGIQTTSPGGVSSAQNFTTGYVDHNKFEFCAIAANQPEIGNDAAEYSQWSENQAVNCAVGVFQQAGNIKNDDWKLTFCTTGIILVPGANGNHGEFNAPIVNHCPVAVAATNVTVGEQFNGGIMQAGGQILLNNCNGILFSGVQFSGAAQPIVIANTPAGGANLFTGCKFQGDWALVKQTITNDGGGIFLGNFCWNFGGVTNTSDGSFANGSQVIKPIRYPLSTANGGNYVSVAGTTGPPSPYFDIDSIFWAANGGGGVAILFPAQLTTPSTNSVCTATILNTNTASLTITNFKGDVFYFGNSGRQLLQPVIYNTITLAQGYNTITWTNRYTNSSLNRLIGMELGQGNQIQNVWLTKFVEQPIQ